MAFASQAAFDAAHSHQRTMRKPMFAQLLTLLTFMLEPAGTCARICPECVHRCPVLTTPCDGNAGTCRSLYQNLPRMRAQLAALARVRDALSMVIFEPCRNLCQNQPRMRALLAHLSNSLRWCPLRAETSISTRTRFFCKRL